MHTLSPPRSTSGDMLILMLIRLPLPLLSEPSSVEEESLLELPEVSSASLLSLVELLVPSLTLMGSQTETPTPVQVLSPPTSVLGERFTLMLIKGLWPAAVVLVIVVIVVVELGWELELPVLLPSSCELLVLFAYFFPLLLVCTTVMGSQAEMPSPKQEPSLLRSRSGEMFGLRSMRDRPFVLRIGRLEVRPSRNAKTRRAADGAAGRCMVPERGSGRM